MDDHVLEDILSDPGVILVECEVRHVQRWYNLDDEEVFPNVRL